MHLSGVVVRAFCVPPLWLPQISASPASFHSSQREASLIITELHGLPFLRWPRNVLQAAPDFDMPIKLPNLKLEVLSVTIDAG